jgi:hypothetical protein
MTVQDAVTASAAKYALSPELLAAQVLVESSGDPFAFRYEPAFFKTYIRGNAKAKAARFGPLAACSYGPLQILLETACELGFEGYPEELFNPARGVDLGAKYMATLLAWAKGDYTKAWCAYNGGKGAVASLPYPNQVYADKVLAMKGKALTT